MEHGKTKCLGCIQIRPGTSRKGKTPSREELGVQCHMFLFRVLCLQLLREWQQELSHPHYRLQALGLPHTPGNSSPFWWNRQYSTQLVKHVADQLDSGLLCGLQACFLAHKLTGPHCLFPELTLRSWLTFEPTVLWSRYICRLTVDRCAEWFQTLAWARCGASGFRPGTAIFTLRLMKDGWGPLCFLLANYISEDRRPRN